MGGYDELVVLRDIRVVSFCEHHMLPFLGRAHVGYLPSNRVVGISKLARVVNGFARRLQIQEKLTAEIAEAIQDILHPKGVGVVIVSEHSCMTMRGVNTPGSRLTTSHLLGEVRDDPRTRQEFLRVRQERLEAIRCPNGSSQWGRGATAGRALPAPGAGRPRSVKWCASKPKARAATMFFSESSKNSTSPGSSPNRSAGQGVEGRIRLHDLVVGRHHVVLQPREGRAHGDGPRKVSWDMLVSAVLRHARDVQRLDGGLGLRDRAGEHVPPPGFPGVDGVGIFGEALQQRRAVVREGHAQVVGEVPFHGADMGKEPVAFAPVPREIRLIERARIPAHDHITDVPKDGFGSRHLAP